MATLIASICSTLIILAFCQIIIETILPDGGTKRYVVFLTGLVAVIAIVSVISMSGQDVLKTIYSRTAELQNIAERQQTQGTDAGQADPYRDYIQRLIDAYR